ncbi:6-hydroxymethylpterin diphosphokinase MptE-like protein [Pseudomonas baltica]|uniref:motility associated factor glycosyltransferase family protein n=1 Tax=Pseudomonas baltica TaxID=2762576 RepID=UPI00289C4B9E|nr:6-hydroxymethylpterin diphosphokinase MptE-like protein [Pseudomonas baltica]
MNETFQANGEVLERRWPALWARLQGEDLTALSPRVTGCGSTLSIDGVQLTSRYDRVGEARLQADSLALDSTVVHLYGTALGDLQGVLLERPALRTLQVYIVNSALFVMVLGLLDQRLWLGDPRVELSLAGEQVEMALPFFALPGEMVLADDFNARMRDRLVSETHLAFNNRHFAAAQPHLLQRLQETETLVRSDPDVARLFDTLQGREVLVIATGPSLEQHFAALKAIAARAERPLIICVDTAYRPLRKQGIVPDLVVSVDQLISERYLPPDDSQAVTLVYLPLVPADVLQRWQGPRYAGYSASPLFDAMRQRLPRGSLHTAGSVLHPAVDLAVKMGARRITLFGADFAFPHDKTHAGWLDSELGPSVKAARYWLHDGHGQRVKTQLNFRSYLLELERFIARHPQVQFFNTSRDGALIAGTHYHPEFVA